MTASKGIDIDLDKGQETLGDDLAKAWGMELPKPQRQAQEDDFDPDKPVETVCKKGDIWKLGNHRLMCGDSTDAGDVALLMDGEKADICFTSPPYNMGRNSSFESAPNIAMKTGKAYNEYSDDLSDENYSTLLIKSCKNGLEHCDDVLFNIGVLSNSKKGIVAMLQEFQDNFFEILTWKKKTCLPLGMKSQNGMVSHLCEPIFCFNKDGLRRFSHPQWQAGCGRNIIETQNASGNEYAKEHAASFPVEFASEAIKMFSDNSVLDLFGGTGTTLIASEQLNRKCYMMELDPHYCDVIIARWEKLTGNKAERISNGN
jgi:DNA modification methylase